MHKGEGCTINDYTVQSEWGRNLSSVTYEPLIQREQAELNQIPPSWNDAKWPQGQSPSVREPTFSQGLLTVHN